jgi:hypothetical protein
MSVELKLLVWSAALALIQMVIAVGAAILQVGFLRLIGDRAISPVLPGGRIARGERSSICWRACPSSRRSCSLRRWQTRPMQ